MSKFLLPPVWLLIGILLMLGLRKWFPVAQVQATPWMAAGALCIALGLLLDLLASLTFWRHQTPLMPYKTATSLVTGGVYRISRNPIYLGQELILIGVALLLGAVTPFAICIVFPFVIQSRFIRAEERMLAERFGEDWKAYAAKVRRWL